MLPILLMDKGIRYTNVLVRALSSGVETSFGISQWEHRYIYETLTKIWSDFQVTHRGLYVWIFLPRHRLRRARRALYMQPPSITDLERIVLERNVEQTPVAWQ